MWCASRHRSASWRWARRTRTSPRPPMKRWSSCSRRRCSTPAAPLSGRNRQEMVIAAGRRPAHHGGMAHPHTVAVVAFDGLQLLDLAGPVEVLRTATRLGAAPPYRTLIATPDGAPVRSRERRRAGSGRLDRGARPRRAPDRHARGRGWRRHPGRDGDAVLRRRSRRPSRRARRVDVGLLRLVPPRRGRAPRRLRGDDALGVVRSARRAVPAGHGARGPDLRARPRPLDLRGRHRRHRSHASRSWSTTTARSSRMRWQVGSSCSCAAPAASRSSACSSAPMPAASPSIAELQRWLPDHLDRDLSVEALAARVA